MSRVEALCISEKKGERKRPVDCALFCAGHGIEGDAHAGPWHRQVSLLALEDVEELRRRGLPQIAPGAFAENVLLSGLDLSSFGVGTRLRLGAQVVLSVTQIGKVCHAPCVIGKLTGACIMPERGLFARVEQGGLVSVGDPAEVLRIAPRGPALSEPGGAPPENGTPETSVGQPRGGTIDVSHKRRTLRRAVAVSVLEASPEAVEAISNDSLPKRGALGAARAAGLLAAKKTSGLIPHCHPVALTSIRIDFQFGVGTVTAQCEVKAFDRTGPEMEALCGAAVAALTLYDMVKGRCPGALVRHTRVVEKEGGKSGHWRAAGARQQPPQAG